MEEVLRMQQAQSDAENKTMRCSSLNHDDNLTDNNQNLEKESAQSQIEFLSLSKNFTNKIMKITPEEGSKQPEGQTTNF